MKMVIDVEKASIPLLMVAATKANGKKTRGMARAFIHRLMVVALKENIKTIILIRELLRFLMEQYQY